MSDCTFSDVVLSHLRRAFVDLPEGEKLKDVYEGFKAYFADEDRAQRFHDDVAAICVQAVDDSSLIESEVEREVSRTLRDEDYDEELQRNVERSIERYMNDEGIDDEVAKAVDNWFSECPDDDLRAMLEEHVWQPPQTFWGRLRWLVLGR